MLTPQERQEIEAELAHYPVKRALCLDALQVVQRHRGWVSDEALGDVAAFLGMSATEVDGVATFYNLIFRKPVGRHVAFVCDSVSCWILGADGVRERCMQHLGVKAGETTPDGRMTLLPVVCLGACDKGPALLVDDDLHTNVDAENVGRLLDGYR